MARVTGEKFRLRTKMLIHSRQFAFSLNPLLARGYVCSLSDIISAISMPIISLSTWQSFVYGTSVDQRLDKMLQNM